MDAKRGTSVGSGALFPGESTGQLLRSALTGAVATGIDFAIVDGLVRGAAMFPGLATLFGAAVGAVVNYMMNRLWAFRSRAHPGSEIVRYALVSAGAAVLNAGLVSLLVTAQVPYRPAWIVVRAAVFVGFTFLLLRGFVFRRAKPEASGVDAPP